MSKRFDIAVHGATGFTGRLVAEYLAQHYPAGSGLRWALSGRNLDRLAQVRQEIGAAEDTALIATDNADAQSLDALMAQTRLVISTVGPYQVHGNELLAACANNGVDYVDLCGEPNWMRQMIDGHEAAARASGARIVFSCGFDSVPFDLGVFELQREFQARFGHAASQVRGRVRRMKGTFSGGTAASLKATLDAAENDPEQKAQMLSPFSLTPGFVGPEQLPGDAPRYDEAAEVWLAPFVMAIINTRNIHRSNFLLQHRWGQDFRYDEMFVTGRGEKGEALARAIASDTSMTDGKGPKAGEGPSKEEREAGYFDLAFLGSDAAGNQLSCIVKGDRDPGYGSTSRMISEAAICLLEQPTQPAGGIYTPASAMGSRLIDRLSSRGVLSFETTQP